MIIKVYETYNFNMCIKYLNIVYEELCDLVEKLI